jgi:uncharacterized membrane protein
MADAIDLITSEVEERDTALDDVRAQLQSKEIIRQELQDEVGVLESAIQQQTSATHHFKALLNDTSSELDYVRHENGLMVVAMRNMDHTHHLVAAEDQQRYDTVMEEKEKLASRLAGVEEEAEVNVSRLKSALEAKEREIKANADSMKLERQVRDELEGSMAALQVKVGDMADAIDLLTSEVEERDTALDDVRAQLQRKDILQYLVSRQDQAFFDHIVEERDTAQSMFSECSESISVSNSVSNNFDAEHLLLLNSELEKNVLIQSQDLETCHLTVQLEQEAQEDLSYMNAVLEENLQKERAKIWKNEVQILNQHPELCGEDLGKQKCLKRLDYLSSMRPEPSRIKRAATPSRLSCALSLFKSLHCMALE